MEPWYKVAIPRKEVREGRSFNPDAFAIALEQVAGKTAPQDYSDPAEAVCVGSAWDAQEGRERPWIDVARQLAGEHGVEALGKSALSVPPGTESLGRVFEAAGAPLLILFDEVLNFLNRHRNMAEPF